MTKRKIAVPEPPQSYHDRYHALGLEPAIFLPTAFDLETVNSFGGRGYEAMPELLVGPDRTVIIYRAKGALNNSYAIAGWVPHYRHWCGGLRADLHSALAWLERARDVHAGKATDFAGA